MAQQCPSLFLTTLLIGNKVPLRALVRGSKRLSGSNPLAILFCRCSSVNRPAESRFWHSQQALDSPRRRLLPFISDTEPQRRQLQEKRLCLSAAEDTPPARATTCKCPNTRPVKSLLSRCCWCTVLISSRAVSPLKHPHDLTPSRRKAVALTSVGGGRRHRQGRRHLARTG